MAKLNLTRAEIVRYAERYKIPRRIADECPAILQLLRDKIHSDAFIAELKSKMGSRTKCSCKVTD